MRGSRNICKALKRFENDEMCNNTLRQSSASNNAGANKNTLDAKKRRHAFFSLFSVIKFCNCWSAVIYGSRSAILMQNCGISMQKNTKDIGN